MILKNLTQLNNRTEIQSKKNNENTAKQEQKNETVDNKNSVNVESEKPTVRAGFCSLFKYVYWDVVLSVFAYLTILLVAFLRGGDGMKSVIGLDFCSGPAWGLFVMAQVLCIACALGSVFRNRKKLLDPNNSGIQEQHEGGLTEERMD